MTLLRMALAASAAGVLIGLGGVMMGFVRKRRNLRATGILIAALCFAAFVALGLMILRRAMP